MAIKTLSRELYEQHSLQYPPSEIELARPLIHPHIVRILEVLETPDATYLVLEEYGGGDLFECMQKADVFCEFLARCYLQDLLAGVQYLHDHHIVHRDLKAENCILDLNGMLRIADFGAASHFVEGQLFHDFETQSPLAPPEVLSFVPYEGPPTDIWAIGVILYDMLMGDLPPQRGLQEFHEDTLTVELSLLVTHMLCPTVIHRARLSDVAASAWMSLSVRIAGHLHVVLVSEKDPKPSLMPLRERPLPRPLSVRMAHEYERVLCADLGF